MRTRLMAFAAGLMLLSVVMGLKAEASASRETLVLKDEEQVYKPYTYLDILEDQGGQTTIEDVMQPRMEEKFKDNKAEVPNYGYTAPVH
jgi:hypothetical protein